MKFCTVINCMDGRLQLPVIDFLMKRFKAEFVDTITEPGPNRILAERIKQTHIQSIFDRLEISINQHKSGGIAIVGHHDCAGNPAPKTEQLDQLRKSVQLVQEQFASVETIGLWVDENWEVQEI